MTLLTIMQRADKNDEMLGAFYVWLEELARRVDRLIVIAGYVGTVELPPNVEVYSLGKETGRNKFLRIWRYFELFSKHYARSDAVFFQMCPEFVLAASPLLLSRRRTTALWYSHVAVPGFRAKLAERLLDYVFTPTPLNFRLPSKKVIHTGHALDTELFKPGGAQHQGGVRMLAVGRISPVKDYETIIAACAILKESWSEPWSLSIVGGPVMAGDYPYFERLKKIIREKKLEDRIVFLGAHSYREMPAIYRDHDMFVSMTGTGSFDRAMLEAMASGLTIITANKAFAPFLPGGAVLEHLGPEFLAERIKKFARSPRPNLRAREAVLEHHNLKKTLTTMLRYLSLPPIPRF